MRCQKCGQEIKENWIRCPFCGTNIGNSVLQENAEENSLYGLNENIGNKTDENPSLFVDNIIERYPKEGMEVENLSRKKKPLWKKIFCIIVWVFIGLLLIVGPFSTAGVGTNKDKVLEIIEYYLTTMLVLIMPLLLIINFRGIRDKLPLYKKHKFGSTLLAAFLTFVFVGISSEAVSTIVESRFSEQYKVALEQQRLQREQEKQMKLEAEEKAAEERKAAEEKTTAEKKAEEEKKIAEEEAVEEEKVAAEKKADASPYFSLDYQEYYLNNYGIKMLFSKKREKVINFLKKCDTQNYSNIEIVSGGFFHPSYYKRTRYDGEYVYYGNYKDNKPEGLGVIKRKVNVSINDDGQASVGTQWGSDENNYLFIVYAGNFEDGIPSGYGMQFSTPIDEEYTKQGYKLEIFYQQTDSNIQKSIENSLNPLIYEGGFQKGEYSGDGVQYGYDLIYTAGLQFEIPDGSTAEERKRLEGINKEMNQKDISVFQGEYSEGALNGYCKVYSNGYLYYEGDMKNGIQTGTGVKYYLNSNQIEYKGELRNGVPHGKGTRYYEDGTVEYSGEWEDGDYAG